MKKLLFLGACLVALASQPVMAQTGLPKALASSLVAQTGGANVVIVRVYEYGGKCVIATSQGTDKTELTTVDTPINGYKSQKLTAEAYHQVVAGLIQQGYSLKGISGGDIQTTLIFSK
jgi:hypothetical protein